MVESSSVAAPDHPSNIQSFIDPNGFMSTTWNAAGGGVVQYNMQYRVQNRDDANDITIPMDTTSTNVSNLATRVLYEVGMNVHTYVSTNVCTYTTTSNVSNLEIVVLYDVSMNILITNKVMNVRMYTLLLCSCDCGHLLLCAFLLALLVSLTE